MDIHILDVGSGNMALVLNPDGTRFVIDCNITTDNRNAILSYTKKVFGSGKPVNVFINTHRDADHMRGITDLHAQHTILEIKDTDVPGTTTDSPEYNSYMKLRRSVEKKTIIKPFKYIDQGTAKYRFMNGQRDDYTDVNQQSAVIKIEYKVPGCSVMFAADTDFRPWKEKILPHYSDKDIKSSFLIAAHHGSITFFDDPNDTSNYYVEHIQKINPDMTLVSIGPNQHGLPDRKAIDFYIEYSKGSKKGNRIFTTEEQKNIKITLKDDGGWSLSINQ